MNNLQNTRRTGVSYGISLFEKHSIMCYKSFIDCLITIIEEFMKRISSIFLMILFPSLLFSAAMDNSAWVPNTNDSAAIKANKTDGIIGKTGSVESSANKLHYLAPHSFFQLLGQGGVGKVYQIKIGGKVYALKTIFHYSKLFIFWDVLTKDIFTVILI